MPKVICIIPARLYSERLPEKVIARISDVPMIQLVYNKARESGAFHGVYVATSDPELARYIPDESLIMTQDAEKYIYNGTDRVVAAYAMYEGMKMEADYIVNIQADMPLLTRDGIRTFVKEMINKGEPFITAATPYRRCPELDSNESLVKVWLNDQQRALMYYREIHDPRHENKDLYAALGIYGWQPKFLREYIGSGPAPLEQAYSIEQYRVKEMGVDPYTVLLPRETYIAVDTKEDLDMVRKIMRGDLELDEIFKHKE